MTGNVKLKTKHIIMLSRLVSKMDFKVDLKGTTDTDKGMEIIMDLISNSHKAEDEFYALVGSMAGIALEEVPDMEIDELVGVFKAIWNKLQVFFDKPTD